MKRRTEGPRRWRAGMLLGSIACLGSVLAVAVGQGSAGATTEKPFAVVICAPGQSCQPGNPPVVSPGATSSAPATVTAVITDETNKGSGVKIGSLNLTPPAGVTVVSATLGGTAIGPCTATTPANTSCITSTGVLQLRSLNVEPGGSIQVTMGVTTPPPPSNCTTASPCQWGATAKQSNEYNGTPGNNLNLDTSASQLGMVLTSQTTCTPGNTCSATIGDGGTAGSPGGSINITTVATGGSGGTLDEAIDYGPHLDPSDCSGVNSVHDEYITGTALNGPNASPFTVTINTTDYPGYQAEFCLTTSQPFTAKVIHSDGTVSLEPAIPVTQPDGTPGYAGLLADCPAGGSTPTTTGTSTTQTPLSSTGPTVNCDTNPGVVSRSTSPDGTVHTIVARFPAGFDATMRN